MNNEVPKEIYLEFNKENIRIIKKNIGFFKRLKIMRTLKKKGRKFLESEFKVVREKGLKDNRYLYPLVGKASYFSAMCDVIGKEKTIEIDKELSVVSARLRLPHMMPSVESIMAFENPFAAFKEWLIAYFKANKNEGIYEFDVVENTEKAFQVNCTYCAYCKIGEIVGVKESAVGLCQLDESLFSYYEKIPGLKYTRSSSLMQGGSCCDFRFEKV